jgi:phosphoribosyl 1,2-cyclic phosphodiesterase
VSACRFHSHSVTEINRHRRSFSGTPKLQRNHPEGKNFFLRNTWRHFRFSRLANSLTRPTPSNPLFLCYVIGIRSRVRLTGRVFSLTVLGSGSAGNCSLISTGECRLLVDAGFSARQITHRLESVGVHPESLDGILITHEHNDHVAGLEIFCRRFCVPIYANPLTAETLRHRSLADFPNWNLFATGAVFSVKDIEVQSFYVPHDAVDPTAFVFTAEEGSIGFLTDLGYAPKLAVERLRQVDALVVETNHDERMLQEDTRRPWSVKQRILSRHGHLSNDDAAKLVASIAGHRLRRVVLGHLSRDCNRADLALGAMRRCGLQGIDLFCAEQNNVSPTFVVSSPAPSTVGEQINPVRRQSDNEQRAHGTFDFGWQFG